MQTIMVIALLLKTADLVLVQGADILSPSGEVHAQNGERLTFKCELSPFTNVTYSKWKVSDVDVGYSTFSANPCTNIVLNETLYEIGCSSAFTLTIKKLTPSFDSVTIQCIVFANKEFNLSEKATIKVTVPVQSVIMTRPTGNMVTVRENRETEFVCITSGGLPAPSVRWYKDERTPATSDDVDITASANITKDKTNDDLVSVTSILKYSPQKVDNGSKIYCTASNSDNTLNSTRQPELNVQYSPNGLPKIVNLRNSNMYRVIENYQGILSCSIQGGNPLATLSWICYNFGSASVTDGNTVIKNVTWTARRDQDRSCTCQSSHVIAGNQNVSVSVKILHGPDEPVFKVNDRTVSGSVSFIEGKTRNVVCNGNGSPTANVYRWIKGENNVSYTKMLPFNNVQRKDKGQYLCKVQNTMNPTEGRNETRRNSSDINIIVLFAPSTPSFYYGSLNGQQVTGNVIDVIREDTFNIACKSDGQPEPTYIWSGQTSDNHILAVTSIHETDNLKKTCTVTNTMNETYGISEQGSAHSQLTFNVSYPPQIDTCTLTYLNRSAVNVNGLVAVIEGSSFSLTCTATSKPAVDSYSWAGPVSSSSASLTVTMINKQQNGSYTLTARNTMIRTFGNTAIGNATKKVVVDILYGPEVGRLSDKDIEAGSALNTSCPVIKGNPSDTTFMWSRSKDKSNWNDQILFINNVSKNDDDMYTCRVQNEMIPTGANQQYGEDTRSFHLNVLYYATVTKFFVQGNEGTTVTVSENASLPFVCEVDSNPGAQIELMFQGKLLYSQDNSKSLIDNHTQVSCLDAGIYTCRAKNQYNRGTHSMKDLTIQIQCHPRSLIPVEMYVYSALRTSAVLNFTGLAYPVPDPSKFIWQKFEGTNLSTLSNSSAILIYILGSTSYLIFKNVSQSDYGKYQLFVENEVGKHTEQFFLIAQDVPELPTDFRPNEELITETSALLQWKPGFNGGAEQTFILMYKKSTDVKWMTETVIDTEETIINHTLTGLVSGAKYTVVIYAKNRIGNSSGTRDTTFTTAVKKDGGTPGALIGGAIGGGVSLAIVVLITILLVRKFRKRIGGANDRAGMNKGLKRVDDDDSSEDEVITENVAYQSADEVARVPRANDVYAKPQKKSHAAVETGDVYAVVNKSKHSGKKMKQKEKKKKLKKGDIYENSPVQRGNTYSNSAFDDNPYETPEATPSKPKRNVNKDGLIYADLSFSSEPKGQRKLVIHGLDNMTEYVEVDFTKKADPLPDSDTEEKTQ